MPVIYFQTEFFGAVKQLLLVVAQRPLGRVTDQFPKQVVEFCLLGFINSPDLLYNGSDLFHWQLCGKYKFSLITSIVNSSFRLVFDH
jgi:hypothetical protein